MKNFEDILPVLFAIVVAIFLFLGFITAIKKSLKPPAKQDTIDSSITLKEQSRRIKDINRNNKEQIRLQKQRIRDMQR